MDTQRVESDKPATVKPRQGQRQAAAAEPALGCTEPLLEKLWLEFQRALV